MNQLKLSFVFIILMHLQLSIGQPGFPDSDFGTDGKVTTDFKGQNDQGRAIALQSDHKIIVAGISHNGSDQDFALARYHIDGSLDHSFGNNGSVITDIHNNDFVHSILIQNDGKILLAGHSYPLEDYDVTLVRYNTDGSLDITFGTNGIATTPFGGEDQCRTFGIQADGKIVCAGFSQNATKDFSLFRYTISGELDLTFGTNGRAITEIGDDDVGSSLYIGEDERMILAGYYDNGTDLDIALARYKANGDLDLSFGKNGITKTNIESNDDIANSVTIQDDGKILVAGSTTTDSGRDLVILRYNSEGIRDIGFGSRGIKTIPVSTGDEYCEGMVLQPDGKILITGYAFNDVDFDFFIVRCNTDGTLDETFGVNGFATTSFGSGNDYGKDIALQADGRIVVAGFFDNGTDNDFAIARYLSGLNVADETLADQKEVFGLYPNPLSSKAALLKYEVKKEGWGSISLFDSQGRLSQVLVPERWTTPGLYEERLSFNPSLPPGIYFLVINSEVSRRTCPVIFQY